MRRTAGYLSQTILRNKHILDEMKGTNDDRQNWLQHVKNKYEQKYFARPNSYSFSPFHLFATR
jgi:hypothetical protein